MRFYYFIIVFIFKSFRFLRRDKSIQINVKKRSNLRFKIVYRFFTTIVDLGRDRERFRATKN